jgi:hypothetical protein
MSKIVPHFWVAAAGVALTFLGLFGPWVNVVGLLNVNVSGLDTDDGKLVALFAVGALAFLALYAFRKRSRLPLAIAGIFGLLVAVGAGYDLFDISSSVNEVDSEFARASVGWGLYATVLGGAAVCGGSLLTMVKQVRVRPSVATSQA